MEGFDRIRVPTPFHVGRVNCYVFGGEAVTLLDPGPATDDAYETLAAGLEEAGYAVADVDRVLITHPHMDHFGIASRVSEESGARVVAHADAAEQLADPAGHLEREQAFFTPFLVSMGVPERFVDTVVGLPEPYEEFREPVVVDRELEAGDVVDVGFELESVDTPGHAPGSMCYLAADRDLLFTGDHVMEQISPNPLLTLVPGTEDERTRSLPTYLDSLRTVLSIDAERGYAGHREPVADLHGRAREILDHHAEREETVADLLAEHGPTTAYDVMGEMFPDLPVTETFAGMSEVVGHLDLLEDEGRIEVTREDGVLRYGLA